MYAVFVSGGKQYRVKLGQTLKLEKLEAEAGASVIFDKVLMLANEGQEVHIGTPYLSGKVVKADVVEHGRGEKIRIMKMKRRKTHRKTIGHRQWFTEIKITAIGA